MSEAFIGRTHELEEFASRLKSPVGRPAITLIAGEPGVGKTRLLSEVMAAARSHGWLTLLGHAYDTEGMPPYLPFAEAITQHCRVSQGDQASRRLAEVAPEVALLIPELRERVAFAQMQPAASPGAERYRLFEAVSDFFINVAELNDAGLVLCLDDLHSADRPSLLLLQHLARRLTGTKLLIVGTYRTVDLDAGHPLMGLLASLSRERLYERLALDRLNEVDSTALFENVVQTPAHTSVGAAVHQLTGGNAFFIEELARHLRSEGQDFTRPLSSVTEWRVPEGVKQVISVRLAHMSPQANLLLQSAAVLGSGALDLRVLAQVSGLSNLAFAESLEEGLKAGLLRQTSSCSFSHALVRETVYEDLSLPRRQFLHLRAAEAIEQTHQANLESWLAELAQHFRLAGALTDPPKAMDYAARAGDRAAQVFAFDEAERLYSQAIQAWDAGASPEQSLAFQLHFKRGRCCASLSMWTEARAEFEACLRLMPPEQSSERADVLNRLAIAAFWDGETRAGREYVEQARVLGEAGLPDDILIATTAVLARLQFSDGQIAESSRSYEEAIERATGRSIATLDELLPAYAHMLYLSGDHRAAIDQCLQCIDVSRRHNDFSSVVYAMGDLGLAQAASGRYDDALETLRDALELGRKHGLTTFLARTAGMRAGPHISLFDYQTAVDLAEEAREVGRSFDFASTVVSAGIDLLFCDARLGEAGKADALLADVTRDASSAADIHGWLWALRLTQVRAESAMAHGDWTAALEAAQESFQISTMKSRVKYQVAALVTQGQALSNAGSKRLGLQELRRAVDLALHAGDPALLLAAGTALLVLEPEAEVAAHSRTAAESILSGLTNLEFRNRFESSEQVRLLYSLTAVSSSHTTPARRSYPGGLTLREVEILRLIAAGKSNQQIADGLVISYNTVIRHVTHVLTKTGCTNRAEAVDYAHRSGLVEAAV